MQTFNGTRAYSEAFNRAIASRHQRYGHFPASADTASEDATVLRQTFSVASEGTQLQVLAWRDYLARILEMPVARSQVVRGFRGELDTYVLRDMIYLDSRTDPMSQARTAQRISNDSMRDYCFHVVMEGIAETEVGALQSDKSKQFVPGVLALDMNQTMRMKRPTRARVLAFFLPRAVVESAIPGAESLHGKVVAYTSPLACLLREHLLAVYTALPIMSDAEVDQALHIAAELILATYSKEASHSRSARAAARAAMLGRIKRYIDTQLHSHELAPETILSRFPLARATLYRLFEQEGGLHAYIRNCRLREAADELVRSRSVTIADIGDRLGFSYAADFTRAFRRAYGMAPKEFRALELDWLDRLY